jgi:dynein light intermediate chain, axonemal
MAALPFDPAVLLRYDPPALVTTRAAAGEKAPTAAVAAAERALARVLPPRTTTRDGGTWVQRVSRAPATVGELAALEARLDDALTRAGARDVGVCPLREAVYDALLDELVRQATVDCAERGLVLARVRDELRATCGAYRALYESALAFGLRRALRGDAARAELQARVRGGPAPRRGSHGDGTDPPPSSSAPSHDNHPRRPDCRRTRWRWRWPARRRPWRRCRHGRRRWRRRRSHPTHQLHSSPRARLRARGDSAGEVDETVTSTAAARGAGA